MEIENQPRLKNFNLNSLILTQFIQQSLFVTCKLTTTTTILIYFT